MESPGLAERIGRLRDQLRQLLDVARSEPGDRSGTVVDSLEELSARVAAIEESEWRHRALAEAAGDLIFEIRRDGTIGFVNEAACRYLGAVPEEAVGRTISDFFPASDVDRKSGSLMQVFSTGTPAYIESPSQRGSAQRWLGTWLVPIRNGDGTIRAVLGSSRDITERKRLEQHLGHAQKMESVGTLAGGVAHDFNNILTVIKGHTDMALRSGDCSAALQLSLREIAHATERAGELTRQLLTFGRRQPMNMKRVDLNQLVANLSKMIRRLIAEDVELECVYAADVPAVQADPGMIELVVMNLVINARDAMPGGGRLVVRTEAAASAGGAHACIVVQDSGSGIPADVLPRIFDPFFTTKEVGKGTGLGLATVHGVVEQHRGRVEVESVVGAGTTFRIHLPATQEVAPAASAVR